MTKKRVWHSPTSTDEEIREFEEFTRRVREREAKVPPNRERRTLETHFIEGSLREPKRQTPYEKWLAEQEAKEVDERGGNKDD